MGISFGSINSGLPPDIVQKLVEAESIPIKKMETRKAKVENKKRLLTELTSLVTEMRTELQKNKGARSLRELEVKYDSEVMSVTADKSIAEPGNYQFEVMELAQKSSILTNGVEDKDDTYTGVGYIEYELPNGDTREVYVDSEHASLSGIAELINRDTENGMKATVIDDGKDPDYPYRLIVSMDNTGDENKAAFVDFYFVDGEVDLYIDQTRPAKDAKIKIDGFEVEYGDNRIADLIPGLTLDLKKAKPGEEFTIEVTEDSAKVTEKIGEVVAKINAVLKFIKEQNSLDENSDTFSTLGGDLTLQTLESRVRSAIFMPIKTSAGNRRIGDLGINFQRNGLLKFDEGRFNGTVAANYVAASEILTGASTDTETGKPILGFVDRLYNVANEALLQPNGVLQTRKNGLQSNIDRIDRRIADRQRIIQQKEETLKRKFARLEETMSRIKSQGQGLAGLAGAQNSNPIQQLQVAG